MTLDRLTENTRVRGTDRAVSPVVGVALLIAITVILAAVIGFVVLDTTVSTTDAPTARLTFENLENGKATVTHEGGDELDPTNVYVRVDRASGSDSEKELANKDVGETFNTGDTFFIAADPGDTIIVYWDDPQSNREVQIGKASLE
jgi:flagellin-like protein